MEHSFSTYKSNNDASCTTDGTKTAKCNHCDATDTVTDTGSKAAHNLSYHIINGELYHICSNCPLKEISRTVTWSGQNLSVSLGTELQSVQIYAAVYSADNRLIEVRLVEATADTTLVSFNRLANADYVKLFFLGENLTPWLTSMQLLVP